MFVFTRETASGKPEGRLNDRRLNMSFHGRRVPRPTLILSLARVMNSRFVGGDDEVGIVPYVVIVGVCECGREFVFGVWCEEEDFQKGLLVLND